MQLVFASSNQHKIEEIKKIIPASYVISGLKEAGITEEIPETGTTIRENSLLKAKYVAVRLNDKSAAVFARRHLS